MFEPVLKEPFGYIGAGSKMDKRMVPQKLCIRQRRPPVRCSVQVVVVVRCHPDRLFIIERISLQQEVAWRYLWLGLAIESTQCVMVKVMGEA